MFSLEVDDDIALRLMEDADADRLFALIDDCRDHLAEWLPWVPHNTSVDDSVEFVHRARKQFGTEDAVQTGIVYQGELCGAIGAHLKRDRGDLGYWLHPDYQGRGIMTRSCRALIDYLFEYRRLHRLVIRAAPDNERSWAVAERLGFTHEGTHREVEHHQDRYVDLRVYALLRREWKEGVHAETADAHSEDDAESG